MQTYLVGGALRDALLGLAVKDRDWVVVGSTPEAMVAQGYLPVGRDFPVFLHPRTKDEYALARTERKTARGYHGFAFNASVDVTLEQDLSRRDLTVNAIAAAADSLPSDGSFDIRELALIDPYGGQRDLAARVFRHVTPAFREDPVRVLRVARLAARFADFTVAAETMALMREMVLQGEVDHLVAERVWQELAKGLMEDTPSRMFAVLRDCGALARLLPEVDQLWGVPQRAEYHPEVDTGVHLMLVLDLSAQLKASLPVRVACLLHDLGKGTTPVDLLPGKLGSDSNFVSTHACSEGSAPGAETKLESDPNFPSARLLKGVCERLRVPTECRELADVVAREHGNIHRSAELGAAAVVRLLERCDALRKPARFAAILLACECDARGRLGLQDEPYPQRARLLAALAAAQTVATDSIATDAMAKGVNGPLIGELIHKARVDAVKAAL